MRGLIRWRCGKERMRKEVEGRRELGIRGGGEEINRDERRRIIGGGEWGEEMGGE